MIDDITLNTVRALPKIDLHRHLEGSLRLETLLAITAEYGIELPSDDLEGLRPLVQMMPNEPRSWQRFLKKFRFLRQFFRSETIIKRFTREAIADAAADNVKYMELRFTPQALNNLMQCDYEQVVEWVCEAVSEAKGVYDIQVALILSMNRQESVGIGDLVLEAAIHYSDRGVVGLDLAGQEDGYPALPFQDVFQRAKEAGLGVTIHAGEWAGAPSVREAVEGLSADRIGHGIHAVEDLALVDLLAERGTVLEVCPTSNFLSGAVDDFGLHPLITLYRSGVRTTINTDDPLVCSIGMSDEVVQVLTNMPLTIEDVKQNILTAARASFLPADQRETLVAQFQSWLYP